MVPFALTPLDDQNAAEELLVEYLRRLAGRPAARQALRIAFSELPASAGRDDWLRGATNGLSRLACEQRGELFVLANADVLFFFEAGAAPLVAREAGVLRLAIGDASAACADVIEWLDPQQALGKLLVLARRVQAEAARRALAGPLDPPPPAAFDLAAEAACVLTPRLLDRLEAGLAQADLASLLRRHAVCAIDHETRPEPWFVECTVSIGDLARTMAPAYDLAADPRLFQHLTEALDRRMLALIASPGVIATDAVISINLNVATLLSDAFFAFDDGLIAARRGRIVIEIRLDDLIGDLDGFAVVRALCRAKGYRLCLDGLSMASLDLLDAGVDDFDFVKLACGAEMGEGEIGAGGAAEGQWLAATVRRIGAGRLIAARVERAPALALARASGVRLFQGRYIDHLLAEARQRRHFRRLNRAAADDT